MVAAPRVKWLSIAALVMMHSSLAYAGSAGRVVHIRGSGTVLSEGETQPMRAGDRLQEGDQVQIHDGSMARLLMEDRSIIDIGPNSQVTISTYNVQKRERKRKASLKVWFGRLWAKVTKSVSDQQNFEVTSGTAVAGVRGTAFYFDVTKSGYTTVTVTSGSVDFGFLGEAPTTLQALQQGAIGRDGSTTVKEVSQKELTTLGNTLHSDPKEENETLESSDTNNSNTRNGTQVPIDLEPAAGRARVRGEIEVRP